MSKMYRSGLKNISVAKLPGLSIFLFACVLLTPAFALSQYKTSENDFSSSSPNGFIAYTSNGQVFRMSPNGDNKNAMTNPGSHSYPQWSSDGSKLAFMRTEAGSRDIYTLNASGANLVRRTNMGNMSIENFGWSPDETKFAIGAWMGIYYINALDGSNPVLITPSQNYNSLPKFSPDGSKIIFLCSRPYDGEPPTLNDDVCIVNADGTNEINLTHHPASDYLAVFSPDGTKVAFVSNRSFNGPGDIYVMNSDGSNLVNLTNSPDVGDLSPAWSPDGTKIAFSTNRDGNSEIYVMNSDGSNPMRLTTDPAADISPSWQRVASNATVGGRVITIGGRALGNVQIVMIDTNGNLRTALSNAFGYFNFENVATGATYNFSVSSKRYIFNQDSQNRIIIGNTENINFIAND